MTYVPPLDSNDPMEIERPCCYKEFVGPVECWEQLGMRIRWTVPAVPEATVTHMHDPFYLILCLECKKPVPIREVTAWAWTHLFHADNHEGIYREIQMIYDEDSRRWDDQGVTSYEFKAIVYPTHDHSFRLTFNVKFREYMLWVNKFQEDHMLTVGMPRPESDNTPYQVQITKKIFMGNFLSVLLSEEMDYDAILNLDQVTEAQLKEFSKNCLINIISLCNEVNVGGGNEIPQEKISEIVNWLFEHNVSKHKILVGDHTGLGRVASLLTAYIYANNPNLTYEEAYNYVKRRRPMAYCHKGLRNTVINMFVRD